MCEDSTFPDFLGKAESRLKNDEYNKKSRQLHAEVDGFKFQQTTFRDQIVCSFPACFSDSFLERLVYRANDKILLPTRNPN